MKNLLEKIQSNIKSCTKCDLCKTRTNAVPGKGSQKAEIVFIGEAPGRSEDMHGEPFVGAAGKKLTLALENAGLTRESVYITNVVKCRPPNNRVPTQLEKEKCQKHLNDELNLINPKIICIMGNTAFNSILGGTNITKHRGRVLQKKGFKYFVSVHPAATIYNHKLLETFNNDIRTLAEIASDLKKQDIKSK